MGFDFLEGGRQRVQATPQLVESPGFCPARQLSAHVCRIHVASQKKKGKRIGAGSRKGTKYARLSKKQRWIRTIRPIRKNLRELRDEGKIDTATYREFYLLAKGGMFKDKAHLNAHLKSSGKMQEGGE